MLRLRLRLMGVETSLGSIADSENSQPVLNHEDLKPHFVADWHSNSDVRIKGTRYCYQ